MSLICIHYHCKRVYTDIQLCVVTYVKAVDVWGSGYENQLFLPIWQYIIDVNVKLFYTDNIYKLIWK